MGKNNLIFVLLIIIVALVCASETCWMTLPFISMTPTFILRYGVCKGCLLFFGPPTSDGRGYVQENQL